MKHIENKIHLPAFKCTAAIATVMAGLKHVRERRGTITKDLRTS
jgi:hypothetical protein